MYKTKRNGENFRKTAMQPREKRVIYKSRGLLKVDKQGWNTTSCERR